MIRSRDCEDRYHHLCDGWYGHQAAECRCECHTAEPDMSEDVAFLRIVAPHLLDREEDR